MNKRTIVAICTISFALVVGVVAGLSAGPAATFTVNSTLDATDVNPGNGVCETAAGNGVCTLRAAVQETNALVGADTIVVPAGTYLITIDGVTEDNAVSGDLDITDDLIVSGAGIDSTIIDGNALDRIFHIPDSASPAVEITSLTTRNGASFRSNIGLFEYGAGVYNGSGTLTLTSVEIDDNYGGWGGGAIYNAGTLAATNSYITNNYSIFGAGGIHNLGSGDLTMTGSSINNNLGGGQGGGIYNLGNVTISDSVLTGNQSADGGGVYSSGALTITDSTIYSNMTFGGGEGGGMYIGSGTGDLITITNSNIHDNSATWGGGLYVAAGHVVITGSQIDSNAAGLSGGGLYVRPGPVITVTQTSISGNSFSGLGGYGGGIYLLCGYMTIRESTIEGNTATTGSTSYGGGIDAGGTLTLTNSTVSANQANQGGGINFSSCGAVVLTNSTIANNTATSGGGIQDQQYYGGSLTLKNSVVADNSGGNCVNFGEVHSAGYNLDSGNTCGFTNPGDLINTDPLLGPLQDNGGPTWTHALLEGSPAVDAADNVGCPTIDQRGISRPQDGDGDGSAVCDIGAFEHPPTAHQLHLPAVMNQATRPGAGPRWR